MQISLREPGSAITHFIAMLFAMGSGVPLLMKASQYGTIAMVAMFVFISTMILLYEASATYHYINVAPGIIKIFQKIDHMMIFVMIDDSYTPICLLVLEKTKGIRLLIAVWSIAIVGMIIKLLWITCPKWFSSTLYITMGWLCISAMGNILESLSFQAFLWLLIGGIIYTIGGIIYALKFHLFRGPSTFRCMEPYCFC